MVDVTSQDNFYENLTLGLIKLLNSLPGARDVRLEKRSPCERLLLSSWEQRHCSSLPDDLRQFYLSTDGFMLTWNYEYAGQVLRLGNMRINAITELRRLAGVKSLGDAESPTLLDIEMCSQASASDSDRPNFGVKCKIFELDPCQVPVVFVDGNPWWYTGEVNWDIGTSRSFGMAKVCLVYLDKGDRCSELRRTEPRIWLLDRCFEWHFLAPDFTTYFRMMLVHQGLPLWQFRCTSMGLTPWAEQMFTLVAPHLLQPDVPLPAVQPMDWGDTPYNHLDPTIFKTRSKTKKNKLS